MQDSDHRRMHSDHSMNSMSEEHMSSMSSMMDGGESNGFCSGGGTVMLNGFQVSGRSGAMLLSVACFSTRERLAKSDVSTQYFIDTVMHRLALLACFSGYRPCDVL